MEPTRDTTLQQAKNEIAKRLRETLVEQLSLKLYNEMLFYERLEGLQLVRGNGHHMAQNVTRKVEEAMEALVQRLVQEESKELDDRWQQGTG